MLTVITIFTVYNTITKILVTTVDLYKPPIYELPTSSFTAIINEYQTYLNHITFLTAYWMKIFWLRAPKFYCSFTRIFFSNCRWNSRNVILCRRYTNIIIAMYLYTLYNYKKLVPQSFIHSSKYVERPSFTMTDDAWLQTCSNTLFD